MRDVDRAAHEGARALGARDWEAYGDLFAEDLVMRTPGLPGATRGRDARVELAKGMYAAFPEGRAEIEAAFQEGDWGCIMVRFSGVNTGPMAGPDGAEIPPTGKPAEFSYCMVMRFEDGRIAELNEFYDQLDFLAQLGLA